MNIFVTVIAAVFVFSILILIHELGHFYHRQTQRHSGQ